MLKTDNCIFKSTSLNLKYIRQLAFLPFATILKEADARRSLINRIRKRQATFIGHVIKRDGLDRAATLD